MIVPVLPPSPTPADNFSRPSNDISPPPCLRLQQQPRWPDGRKDRSPYTLALDLDADCSEVVMNSRLIFFSDFLLTESENALEMQR
ncbi:hypothetical protein L1887_12852 [Cichorium endivia]|nr:hypothetical protein L1887_12852 [Cichorium endivia]